MLAARLGYVWRTFFSLAFLVLLGACSDDKEPPRGMSSVSSSPTPTATGSPAPPIMAGTQPPRPTGTPPVLPPPSSVGTNLPVWLYNGARSGQSCAEMVDVLVPASAVGRPGLVRGECLVDPNTALRLVFEETGDGIFALDRVKVLLLYASGSSGVQLCTDAPLLPANANPDQAPLKGQCEVEPLPRDQGMSDRPLAWTALPAAASELDIPPTTPCSGLVYLYSGLEDATPIHRLCTLR